MAASYGSWATAMAPNTRSPLDAFWRRRMGMLTTLQHTPPRPTRGQRARLALLAGLLLALPTAAVVGTPQARDPGAPPGPRPPQPPGEGAPAGPVGMPPGAGGEGGAPLGGVPEGGPAA